MAGAAPFLRKSIFDSVSHYTSQVLLGAVPYHFPSHLLGLAMLQRNRSSGRLRLLPKARNPPTQDSRVSVLINSLQGSSKARLSQAERHDWWQEASQTHQRLDHKGSAGSLLSPHTPQYSARLPGERVPRPNICCLLSKSQTFDFTNRDSEAGVDAC